MAERTFSANDASWRERNRVNSDAAITSAGTASSIAACTVQRPSPESCTWPENFDSAGSSISAFAVRSISHDDSTLPRRQTSAMSATGMFGKRCCSSTVGLPAPRTKRAEGADPRAELGYIHAGPVGAGHFVKMVHNGIEYGIMQALAEGFDIMRGANNPTVAEEHRFDLPVADIAEVWRRGSVLSSWLIDLTAKALIEDPALAKFSGHVQDSGEGRWTVMAAVEEAVPADVIATSLFTRFRSRQEHSFAEKVLSAMRFQFGGHVERPTGG